MRRQVVLLARPPDLDATPPGVAPDDFARALVEDTYEAVRDLARVDVAVAVPPDPEWRSVVTDLLWPGTPLVALGSPAELLGRWDHLEGCAVALVAADAPDLPGLIVAGVFSALDTVPVAAAPAVRGGLVALGSRTPMPPWLRTSEVDLDAATAVDVLRAAAPPEGLQIARAWRRLRTAADIASLDPGLEGWEATRVLLGG